MMKKMIGASQLVFSSLLPSIQKTSWKLSPIFFHYLYPAHTRDYWLTNLMSFATNPSLCGLRLDKDYMEKNKEKIKRKRNRRDNNEIKTQPFGFHYFLFLFLFFSLFSLVVLQSKVVSQSWELLTSDIGRQPSGLAERGEGWQKMKSKLVIAGLKSSPRNIQKNSEDLPAITNDFLFHLRKLGKPLHG